MDTQWSAWEPHPHGYEFRYRLDCNGEYEYEYRRPEKPRTTTSVHMLQQNFAAFNIQNSDPEAYNENYGTSNATRQYSEHGAEAAFAQHVSPEHEYGNQPAYEPQSIGEQHPPSSYTHRSSSYEKPHSTYAIGTTYNSEAGLEENQIRADLTSHRVRRGGRKSKKGKNKESSRQPHDPFLTYENHEREDMPVLEDIQTDSHEKYWRRNTGKRVAELNSSYGESTAEVMTSQIYGGSEYSGGYALPAESHSSAEPQRGSMGSEFSNSSHSLYENSTIDDSSQQNSRYFSNDPAYEATEEASMPTPRALSPGQADSSFESSQAGDPYQETGETENTIREALEEHIAGGNSVYTVFDQEPNIASQSVFAALDGHITAGQSGITVPGKEYIGADKIEYHGAAETSTLDNKYTVEPSWKFQPGEVFKILWADPRGSEAGAGATEKTTLKDGYNESFYVGIRRFIIIATDEGNSTCVPILTYRQQGCAKSGVKPKRHGIIYGSNDRKLPKMGANEPTLGFPPIKMSITAPGEKLHPMSRVNYGKVITIEHNVKVYFIGRLEGDNFVIARDATDVCWAKKNKEQTKDQTKKHKKQR